MSEPWSRRVFLRTAAGGTAGMAAWSLLSARGPAARAAGGDTTGVTRPDSSLGGGVNGPTAKITAFDAGYDTHAAFTRASFERCDPDQRYALSFRQAWTRCKGRSPRVV